MTVRVRLWLCCHSWAPGKRICQAATRTRFRTDFAGWSDTKARTATCERARSLEIRVVVDHPDNRDSYREEGERCCCDQVVVPYEVRRHADVGAGREAAKENALGEPRKWQSVEKRWRPHGQKQWVIGSLDISGGEADIGVTPPARPE